MPRKPKTRSTDSQEKKNPPHHDPSPFQPGIQKRSLSSHSDHSESLALINLNARRSSPCFKTPQLPFASRHRSIRLQFGQVAALFSIVETTFAKFRNSRSHIRPGYASLPMSPVFPRTPLPTHIANHPHTNGYSRLFFYALHGTSCCPPTRPREECVLPSFDIRICQSTLFLWRVPS